MNSFNTLQIDEAILRGLEKKGFTEMTEVQEKVIPHALENKDIIAQAPTGTGKTAAFSIPILQNIDPNSDRVQALILSPTRELAVQILNELQEIAFYKENIRTIAIYGGEYIERQITGLKRRPQIVVATPGRLMDHMRRNTIKLNDISMLVLDEADEMLNMGFREDLDEILESVDSVHQTMLFSATISKDIERIGRTYLKDAETIRVNRNEMNVPSISQRYIEVKQKDKIEVMSRIIDVNDYKLIIVFCNTKRMVDEVSSSLMMRGFIVEALHGDMKQMQRDRVMSRFRAGSINILVASDVAARGLDVDDVDVVFNYDIPTDEEYYVHRIGRTGRAKREGLAITLLSKSEKHKLRHIMSYSKAVITAMDVPSLDKVMKVRVDRILKEAMDAKTNQYQDTINSAILKLAENDVRIEDLISGLIMLQLSADSDTDIHDDNSRPGKNISRIFFGMGRRDNFKVYQITDMITKRTKMSNADINKIDIHDNFTFFEIPSKFVDELIFAFASPINGRRVIVEEAKPREDSDKPRSRREHVGKPRNDMPRFLKDKPSRSRERSYGGGERRERRPYEGDRIPFEAERKERKPYEGDRKPYEGERRERKPLEGDRKPYEGERRERKSYEGERRDRKSSYKGRNK